MKKVMQFFWMMTFMIILAVPGMGEAATGKRKNKSPVSPWIKQKNGTFVYQFNVFNLSSVVSMADLKSILEANKKDINRTYKEQYGLAINYKVYPGDQITNPELFKGDRIPFYIVDSPTFLGLHSVQASEPANSKSLLFAFSSIQSILGIEVPSNFPDWTPWASANALHCQEDAELNKSFEDNYGLFNGLQMLSYAISHEFKETLFDDSIQSWVVFDTFAPTVDTWRYAKFDKNGKCINGHKGNDGFIHLPLFKDVFGYGLLTTFQENGDPVSRHESSKLNSYLVDGWRMTNYPVSNFWKGYYVENDIKWDQNGLVELPLQPFAGLHELVFFLDTSSGVTHFGTIVNWGPITYSQRGDYKANNFPPDYTIISFDGKF